jgi:FecR-like protein
MSDDKLGPPPVEPLSDVSWARVERGLWSRMDGTATLVNAKKPRVWPWIVTPLVTAAAAAVIILAMRTPQPAQPADAEPTRLVAGESPSRASLGDADITLDAHSAVVVNQHGNSPTAVLERGAAWFSVAPRGKKPPFVVLAGDMRVRVIGTRFRVLRSEERAQVTVDHGMVEVQFRGTVTRVAAHQTWSSEHPATVADTTIADVEPALIEIDPTAPTPPPAVRAPKHHTAAPTTPAPGSSAPPSVPPDQVRYEALEKLEATHPEVAMKGYLALSQGSSPWADSALFSACSLALTRHDPRAETLLVIYLKRFPNGSHVVDAERALATIKGAP